MKEAVKIGIIGEYIDGLGHYSRIYFADGSSILGYAWQNPDGKILYTEE